MGELDPVSDVQFSDHVGAIQSESEIAQAGIAIPLNLSPKLECRVYSPQETQQLLPGRVKDMLLFEAKAGDFSMHISTHADPHSDHFNCGGLRIVPEELVHEDYDNRIAALRLGHEMDQKGDFARLTEIAGPRVRENFGKIHFGKFVVQPPVGARVGQYRDQELMDFIVAGLEKFESELGVKAITGQDLGHGKLRNGQTSLSHLSSRYSGCVDIDTSLPTALGNFYMLKGLLAGQGIQLSKAHVGLVGFGNIGSHLTDLLQKHGVGKVYVCESDLEVRRQKAIEKVGAFVWRGDERTLFLHEPLDAVVFNANGGSLDNETVGDILNSRTIKIVTGCENMIWPDGVSREEEFLRSGKIMPPTELTGMGGWLAAAEALIAKREGDSSFQVEQMFDSLIGLERVGREVANSIREAGFNRTFATALYDIYRGGGSTQAIVAS